MIFTVFTPTFNRKSLLLKIYESLILQDFKDFEWVIVDDGSSDGTKEAIQEVIAQQKLDIKYYYKSNGGKHSAINEGVKKSRGEIFTIVDSDDALLPNALQILYNEWQDIKDDNSICGTLGLYAYYNNAIVGTEFPFSRGDYSFTDIYMKLGIKGDKVPAFKTSILLNYPFPEKKGVNFVFEAVVWHDMAKKYKMRCINEVIQYKQYQKEGLSDSSYKQWYIKGLAFSYFQLIIKNIHPIDKYPKTFIWNYIYLVSNSLLANENYFGQLNKISQKLCYIVAFPRGFWSYIKMKNLVSI